jgi:hypothetical protein
MQEKTKFCALIAGNPEGLRINMYKQLSQYKQVDGYGNMFGRALRQSKFDLLKEYKFCLCPENSVYDGYVTEKLIDAYAGGCVPVYSGDVSVINDFNDKAFLNYQYARNMDWFVGTVKVFDENIEHYQYAYEQPLLKKEPSLNEALAFIHNAVKEMS